MSYGRMQGLANRVGILERKRTGRGMVDDVMAHARYEDVVGDGD